MDLHHRISQHRVRYIIDSYMLMGAEPQAVSQFESYIDELFAQYPHGLIELALVETLTKNWLTIPMQKGVAFLCSAHERLKQWQAEQKNAASISVAVTPSQFSQITGLDPQAAFAALTESGAAEQSAIKQNMIEKNTIEQNTIEQCAVAEKSSRTDTSTTSATVE